MTSAPLLPLLPDGTLPPIAVLLRWLEDLRSDRVDTVITPQLPPLNGSLPDLLRLGAIGAVLTTGQPAEQFRWEGLGGNRVTVAELPPAADALIDDFHRGELPPGPLTPTAEADTRLLLALVELARLEDASSCLGIGNGASWHQVLAAFDRSRTPRLPPLQTRSVVGAGLGAWNPLPFARQTLVTLPEAGRPWAVRDHQGRIAPVQIAEGEGLLTCLRLEALEAVQLEAHDEPAPEANWEVTPSVLDNGIVRAELDALGQVTRLCWDGVFAELAGPAVAPHVDDLPLSGEPVIEVVESGPVRARISVVRTAADGVLHLTYTLIAQEDGLRIDARWEGFNGQTCVIQVPTAHRGCHLHLAGELGRSNLPQARSLTQTVGELQGGVRWATLGDSAGRGLAVVGATPLTLAAEGGLLTISGRNLSFALLAAQRQPGALNLGQAAMALTAAGRSTSLEEPVPAPFRLADLGGLVPLWARRPSEWAGEIVFADQREARGRAYIFPHSRPTEAWRVDAAGNALAKANLTREGDGVEIDHLPGELFIIRWR